MINIYCYFNTIILGFYIGLTENTLEKRAGKNGEYYLGCSKFYNAIKKYGFDNFERWIIAVVDNQEEADQIETFWISELRRIFGNNAIYNIADGGHKGNNKSDEARQKLSISLKQTYKNGRVPVWKGKNRGPISQEQREKQSKAMIGKVTSETTKQKQSEVMKSIILPQRFIKGQEPWNKGKVGLQSTITQEDINMINRLINEGYSQRQIAEITGICRETIKKYRLDPSPMKSGQKSGSKWVIIDGKRKYIDKVEKK